MAVVAALAQSTADPATSNLGQRSKERKWNCSEKQTHLSGETTAPVPFTPAPRLHFYSRCRGL